MSHDLCEYGIDKSVLFVIIWLASGVMWCQTVILGADFATWTSHSWIYYKTLPRLHVTPYRFCPSVFIYLLTSVPAIWFLELHEFERRIRYARLTTTTERFNDTTVSIDVQQAVSEDLSAPIGSVLGVSKNGGINSDFCRPRNLCKKSGPSSDPTKRRAWPGSKPFDILMVFLKEFFEAVDLRKKITRRQTSWKSIWHAKTTNWTWH